MNLPFGAPTFNEFVAEFPAGFKEKYARLIEKKIVAGLDLNSFYPELKNHYLFCVTETATRADMDVLIKEVTS